MSQNPLNRALTESLAAHYGTFYCRSCGNERPVAGMVKRKGRPPACAICQAKTKAHVAPVIDPKAPHRRRPAR